EMLWGRRAFQYDSAVETMNAILKEEPPTDLSEIVRVPPGIQRVVLRCLEKNREERFQSARDLGFALQAVETDTTTTLPRVAHKRPFQWRNVAIAALVLGAAAAIWTASRLMLR